VAQGDERRDQGQGGHELVLRGHAVLDALDDAREFAHDTRALDHDRRRGPEHQRGFGDEILAV
jgi:hypothetical protein